MSAQKAIYAGSFDPFTLGHQNIVQRMQPLYDELIVLIAVSANKKDCFFTPEERKKLIQQVVQPYSNVRVDATDKLVVQYAQQQGARVLIRGVRTLFDVEAEMSLSRMNQALAPDVQTQLVVADSRWAHVSSRWVKEILKSGGSVESLVPPCVARALAR